jgi:hypothetical protein
MSPGYSDVPALPRGRAVLLPTSCLVCSHDCARRPHLSAVRYFCLPTRFRDTCGYCLARGHQMSAKTGEESGENVGG